MNTYESINTYDQTQPVLDRKLSQLISILIVGITIGFVISQLIGDAAAQLTTYTQYEQPVQFEDWHGNVRRSSAS